VLGGVVGGLPLDGPVVLVPVPSRGSVVRARGHDPLLRMTRAAAALARRHGLDARVVPLLRQRVAPADQAGLDATARAANLAGSLAVAPGPRAALARSRRPGRVVVCDDVVTTGATLREAQRALEDGGIAVAALACVAATRKRIGHSLPFSPPPH
jgi:predicted amidophosphoribosyltransferase